MKNYSRLYVTGDGSWGVIDENEFALIDCSMWSSRDFDELDGACDSEKLQVAKAIQDRIVKGILDDITI